MAIIDRIDIGGSLFEIKDIAAGTFITREVSDLLYYYTKDNTFTKDEVRALIAQIQGMSTIPVQALPTASAETMGNIYLVPSSDPETRNLYDEYFTIESGGSYSWEMFGHAAISLDGLVTDEELESALSGKVDKETGKGLSTNDFTDSDKEAVEQSLPLGVQTALDRTQDMDTVRSGAAAGATAYQKPQTGIPASDLASGVIPTALSELSEDTTHRTVTDSEKNAWNETNIIHASVLAFPAAFSNYTREQALAAFGVTNEQFGLIIASVGVYRTLMGGATMAFTNGVFIQSWDAGGITFRRLTFSTIGSEVVYSFSGPLYLANVQSDWNEDDSTKPSFIKHKPDLSMKADKVSSPTAGNFAGLDSYGNLTDSGKKASDFQPTIDNNHKLDYGLLSNTPTIPSDLADLEDVDGTAPTNGQVLTYDSTEEKWTPADPAGGGDDEAIEVAATALNELHEHMIPKEDIADTLDPVVNAHHRPASSYALYNLKMKLLDDEEVIATALGLLDSYKALASAIAPLYLSRTATYAVDDCCMHDAQFWRCTTAVTEPEPFDEAKWTKTNLFDEMLRRLNA